MFHPRAGVNCWRVERAERFALLVDAAAYYRWLHEVLQRARRSIFLVGWDFDSRVRLVPDGGRVPAELGRFLDHLVRNRRELQIHVLAWDFSTVFALERELDLAFTVGWRAHRRLRFRYDAKYPFGASQHQKIVSVDDTLAFTGGLDVTSRRWDTPAHRPEDRRRTDARGEPYAPFHDVQCVLSGPAAVALAELARSRWLRLARCGASRPGSADEERALWPADLVPDLEGVRVAIVRTAAAFGGLPAIREVETSLLESIRGARRTIYLENQYFTADSVTQALAERLRDPSGPEVVMVLPRKLSGWLERRTMLPLAERALFRLRCADVHGRLRLLHPVASRARGVDVLVHAKVGCFDDHVFRVGSANLSNRSMGLDSECDVLVLGESPAHRRAIAGLRDRLIAEHLGTRAERIAEVRGETGSLARTIEALGGGDRTLCALPVAATEPAEPVLSPDWERPMEPTVFLETFLEELGSGRRRTWPRMAALVASALAAAAACAWSGERALPAPSWIEHPMHLTVLLVTGAFVLGSALFVPRNLLVLATVLVVGPVKGALLAVVAIVVASLLAFFAGRLGGRELVRRVAGRRPLGIGRKLAGRGWAGMVLVRLVPIGPAIVVDLACGAARLPVGSFLLGTVLGSLPGIAAFALLGAMLAELVRAPSLAALALAAAPALAIVLAALWLDAYVADHDLGTRREPGVR